MYNTQVSIGRKESKTGLVKKSHFRAVKIFTKVLQRWYSLDVITLDINMDVRNMSALLKVILFGCISNVCQQLNRLIFSQCSVSYRKSRHSNILEIAGSKVRPLKFAMLECWSAKSIISKCDEESDEQYWRKLLY